MAHCVVKEFGHSHRRDRPLHPLQQEPSFHSNGQGSESVRQLTVFPVVIRCKRLFVRINYCVRRVLIFGEYW